MNTDSTRMTTGLRAPMAGVSALLVVSLLLGATLSTKPGLRQTRGEDPVQRAAARQLTSSLAKAVRQLVGSDQHKPALHAPAFRALGASMAARRGLTPPALMPRVGLLAPRLLDLPPPAIA